jgi:superfamily II DNA or RNA helicase
LIACSNLIPRAFLFLSLGRRENVGVINYNELNRNINIIKQIKMAACTDGGFLNVLHRLQIALTSCNFPSHCLKPLQVKCFEYLLRGDDVVAVFPTGFGKSILFQLLPKLFPVKTDKNIVIVVCPLNSIIEDQLKILEDSGITADVFRIPSDSMRVCSTAKNLKL